MSATSSGSALISARRGVAGALVLLGGERVVDQPGPALARHRLAARFQRRQRQRAPGRGVEKQTSRGISNSARCDGSIRSSRSSPRVTRFYAIAARLFALFSGTACRRARRDGFGIADASTSLRPRRRLPRAARAYPAGESADPDRPAAGAGGRRLRQRQPDALRVAAAWLRRGVSQSARAERHPQWLDRLDRGHNDAMDRLFDAGAGRALDPAQGRADDPRLCRRDRGRAAAIVRRRHLDQRRHRPFHDDAAARHSKASSA